MPKPTIILPDPPYLPVIQIGLATSAVSGTDRRVVGFGESGKNCRETVYLSAGAKGASPSHMIEHALSAHHDITHGAGLAIVNPAWMRFAAKAHPQKFVQFAQRIFGLNPKGANDLDTAVAGIYRYEEFLRSIGCPTRLSEVGIGDELLGQYAKDAMLVVNDGKGRLSGNPPMTEQDIVDMLRSVL